MILETAKEVIQKEASAIAGLAERLNGNFEAAVEAILKTSGRVIVTGMGKSGIVGKKIAATLASTGTPAMFLHPAEAFHGDLGVVTDQDIVLAISKSGDTSELYQLIPAFKRLGVKIILFTGTIDSPLSERADIVIDCSVPEEACPNNVIPTSSATAAVVMGDALAVVLLNQRGFTMEDFAQLHPGGALGRRLLTRVSDLMRTGDKIPLVTNDVTIQNALIEMSRGRIGCALVVDQDGRLAGIFTDGDLRRVTEKGRDLAEVKIKDVMTANPRTISAEAMLEEVLSLCETHKITVLAILDKERRPIGIIHLHDILESKLV